MVSSAISLKAVLFPEPVACSSVVRLVGRLNYVSLGKVAFGFFVIVCISLCLATYDPFVCNEWVDVSLKLIFAKSLLQIVIAYSSLRGLLDVDAWWWVVVLYGFYL